MINKHIIENESLRLLDHRCENRLGYKRERKKNIYCIIAVEFYVSIGYI